MIRLKRAYEAAATSDGRRVLVERLWPRGVTKAKLRLDEWLKEVAPSPELRRWFGHDPGSRSSPRLGAGGSPSSTRRGTRPGTGPSR
jgi:uncharacterized protein YeaO (DUF488 family)